MADTELPEYSPRPIRSRLTDTNPFKCQHKLQLENSKGRVWITLIINSRSQNPSNMPLFFDQDVISGEVHLDLDRPENIKGLTITLSAGTTAVGQEEELFLNETFPLWSPHTSSKISGTHTWPFSIAIPAETSLSLSNKTASTRYPLPPSFSERASPAYIDYKLIVTIRRGTFRVNQTISTSFVHLPRSVAEPPSALRTLAYREGTPLLAPEVDPDGWKVLPAKNITGSLFAARSLEVRCTLAIATPVTYASDSPIPLILTLQSTDAQALDLLASKPSVELIRIVAIGSGAFDEAIPRRSNNTFYSTVARAAFFASEDTGKTGKITLQGELHVPKGIKSSFTFPRLSLRYIIALLPPRVAGFVPSIDANEHLIFERVTITLASAPGIRMRSYAPPGYVQETEIDYNVSAGYLENGNQRFLHHSR